MKWLPWLDTDSSNAFAREIAVEFSHNFPPGTDLVDKGAEQRLLHSTEVMGNRAAKFNGQSPMGWFRKARFMATITDSLAAQKHDAAVVDRVVYAVVMRMARRRGA